MKIPGAEQIETIAPARDPGVTSNPNTFGAAIGAAGERLGAAEIGLGAGITHVGDALGSLSAHLYQKRQAAEDQTSVQTYNVDSAPRMAQAELGVRAQYPDGGADYLAASQAASRGAHDGTIADMRARGLNPSETALRHIETSYAGRDMNTRVGAVAYDNNANIEKLKSQNADNINALSAQVMAGGDVDAALKQVDEIAAGATPLYGGAALTAWKTAARTTVQRAAIDGAIEAKDEPRARELQRRFFGDGPLPGQSAAERPEGSPSNDRIFGAIYGQESGSGRNTRTSVTGARGGMQIQPETFKLYAKPGEDINNKADNLAVGRRIIDDLSEKSDGDPARIAVGYFSGPGNIAPPGSATPYKRDVADPTGKTVSSYVADVTRRLAAPDNPNTTLALSYRNRIDSMAAVNRADVTSLVKDDLASIQKTGVGNPSLTNDQITKSLGPNAAEDWTDARLRAKSFYDNTQDFATLPPEQINARLIALAPKPGQEDFVAQDELHTAAVKKADALMELRRKDPAESVADDPEVKRATAAAAGKPDDFIARKAIITARLAAQTRAGISAPAPLPVDETLRLLKPITEAVQLEEASPTPKGQPNKIILAQVQLVKDLKERYGSYADDVMKEVIGQAASHRERTDQVNAAGEVMRALMNGTQPGAKSVRTMRVTQENSAANNSINVPSPGLPSYTLPNEPPIFGPSPTNTTKEIVPSAKSIQILRDAPAADQARLAGLFDKRFGAGAAQKILSQKVAPTGTVIVDGTGEGWKPE